MTTPVLVEIGEAAITAAEKTAAYEAMVGLWGCAVIALAAYAFWIIIHRHIPKDISCFIYVFVESWLVYGCSHVIWNVFHFKYVQIGLEENFFILVGCGWIALFFTGKLINIFVDIFKGRTPHQRSPPPAPSTSP